VQAETWEPTRQEPETRYVTLKAGETFESVALDVYGHPRFGDLLRRINPKVSMFGERPNDEVRAYEASHSFMQQDIEPQAPAFATGYADIIQAVCEDRETAVSMTLAQVEADLTARGLL